MGDTSGRAGIRRMPGLVEDTVCICIVIYYDDTISDGAASEPSPIGPFQAARP